MLRFYFIVLFILLLFLLFSTFNQSRHHELFYFSTLFHLLDFLVRFKWILSPRYCSSKFLLLLLFFLSLFPLTIFFYFFVFEYLLSFFLPEDVLLQMRGLAIMYKNPNKSLFRVLRFFLFDVLLFFFFSFAFE